MTPPISKEQSDILFDLYYTQKNYFGRDRLYQLLINNGVRDISKMQIMNWLKKQELWQLYRKKEKARTIQRTILEQPHKQIGIDLIDMQKHEYNGYKYILTAIDLFSKMAHAEPMKNKENKELIRAMTKIIKSVDSQISSIRSDNGSEFISDAFKGLMKKYNIKQVFSLPYKPQSNGQVERFNGVLKKMLFKSLRYDQSYDWVSILPQILNNYNNSKHETTKYAPNQIKSDDYEDVNNNIKQKVISKREGLTPHLNVDDKVRIQVTDSNDGTNWSKKVYTIIKVYKPRKSISKQYYFLEGIEKKFYDNDLQKVDEIDNTFDEIEQWEVSRLVKPTFKDGKKSYYVKWKGYRDLTIESRDKLMEDIPKMVKNFDKKNNVIWYDSRFTMNK